jgi:catechol 2,3-dioxygenase-like lactoylglutathione lyase family enzyme
MQDELGQSLDESQGILAGSRIIYLNLYVSDLAASRAFYEGMLGLRLIEANDSSVKYDTGQTLLCLSRASDHGVTLAARDRSADLTFLVNDLEGTRAELVDRGVEFSETLLRYEIGATVHFYDPDGHWFSLYEPSEAAMTWPSGEKIRAVLRASGKNAAEYGIPGALRPSSAGNGAKGSRLEGRELVYLFMFVPDADVAFKFYNGALGLQHLECRPCRRGSTIDERGVVKYDAGGLMLTTHHVDADPSASDPQDLHSQRPEPNAAHMKGVAPVFHVTDIELAVKEMARKAIPGGGIVRTEAGRTASFEDPFGRVYYLYEPSMDLLT